MVIRRAAVFFVVQLTKAGEINVNIDFISNIVQNSDFSSFRTIATKFLHSIGYVSAAFSDGSYDGGKDFYLHNDPIKGVSVGIQISVEKNWQEKLRKDAAKLKAKSNTTIMLFVSSRRIPLDTFEQVSRKILQDIGISVTRYDNQAIASEFIRTDTINDLYEIFGIPITAATTGPSTLSPKQEAVSALMLFGASAGDLRNEMFESII